MWRNLSWFLHRLLPWVTLAHGLLFIIFWLTNSLFYASTNDYLADMLGRQMDYVSLLLVVSAILAAGSAILGLSGALRKDSQPPVGLLWVYAFVSLVYILFFYGSFALLFKESPVQSVRLGQLVGYFRLLLDPLWLLGLALLVALLVRKSLRVGKAHVRRPWLWLTLPVLGFAMLWGVALAFPPTAVMQAELPDKPLVIAHRGASMLAPENTLAAADLAVRLGAAGLEADIQLSRDGQEFLLHDDTFDRTTDVASVFPGRQAELAGDFTGDEIAQLNAGKWFVEQDPFRTIQRGLVTAEQIREYEQQHIPLLSDWVDIVRQNQMLFIFDLKQLQADASPAGDIFALTLDVLNQAELRPLVWFLVGEDQVSRLQGLAPGMLAAAGVDYHAPPRASQLVAAGYQLVNAEYGLGTDWVRQYQANGLWVNLYTVDEPWQFSRLWLLGVDSITTSNVGAMVALTRPVLSLPYSYYLLIWGALGLIGLAILVGLIYPVLVRWNV